MKITVRVLPVIIFSFVDDQTNVASSASSGLTVAVSLSFSPTFRDSEDLFNSILFTCLTTFMKHFAV